MIDEPALDRAVRRFPAIIAGARHSGDDWFARIGFQEDLICAMPAIAAEYRRIVAKE